jgi:hypothetical protein
MPPNGDHSLRHTVLLADKSGTSLSSWVGEKITEESLNYVMVEVARRAVLDYEETLDKGSGNGNAAEDGDSDMEDESESDSD